MTDAQGVIALPLQFHPGRNKSDRLQLSTPEGKTTEDKVTDKKHNLIDQKLQELNDDGIDRRGFLKCMAWAGTGLVRRGLRSRTPFIGSS